MYEPDGSEIIMTLTTMPTFKNATNLDHCSGPIAGSVLVAIDLSAESREALVWACKYAENANVPLTILHVVHDPAEAPGKYHPIGTDPFTPMAETAETMLSDFLAAVSESHPELTCLADARTEVLTGLPDQTIVGEAMRLGASLIVVGSRGQTGLTKLMAGSTAQKVMRRSQIPVTIVKGGDH